MNLLIKSEEKLGNGELENKDKSTKRKKSSVGKQTTGRKEKKWDEWDLDCLNLTPCPISGSLLKMPKYLFQKRA